MVLKNLQHLVSLDISGTNLAGVKEMENVSHKPGYSIHKKYSEIYYVVHFVFLSGHKFAL